MFFVLFFKENNLWIISLLYISYWLFYVIYLNNKIEGENK